MFKPQHLTPPSVTMTHVWKAPKAIAMAETPDKVARNETGLRGEDGKLVGVGGEGKRNVAIYIGRGRRGGGEVYLAVLHYHIWSLDG